MYPCLHRGLHYDEQAAVSQHRANAWDFVLNGRLTRSRCLRRTHITTFKLSLADRHSPGSLMDPEGDVAKFLLLRGPYVVAYWLP